MDKAVPRRPEDEPDYLKELLAKAGIDEQHTRSPPTCRKS